MSALPNPLLLSLKPCYADTVFDGLKKAELRRRMASIIKNQSVFVYVSRPRCELRGGFRVGQVWSGTPAYVWQYVSNLASVEKHEFDTYFCGSKVAFAIEITNVWEYENPVQLSFLRRSFDRFVIPQSWRYLKPEEHDVFTQFSVRSDSISGPRANTKIAPK